MKRKLLFLIGGIVLLFIITNPSPSALKDHLGAKSTLGIQRKYNFFIFSIYTYDINYVGIIGNFFEVKEDTMKTVAPKNPIPDTVYNVNGFIYNVRGNAKETLYDSLILAGYTMKNLGDKDTFYRNVTDSIKASKLYDVLIKETYTKIQLGTREQFIYYLSKK
jgi:hypothetical protein